ncbi:MAG: hypothetical protein J0H99_09770 [Rhodospirillales bacterium]|nr:hypothetical protein [Rhodospirillales bacterium]
MILPESEIKAAYPDYKDRTLIFGNCFLYIIGEAHGPFKIAKTSRPLSRFQSLSIHTHLDIRLWQLSRLPVGIDRQIQSRVHRSLEDYAIKRDWFDISLQRAIGAVAAENPLGQIVDLAGLTYERMLKMDVEHWGKMGILTLNAERS